MTETRGKKASGTFEPFPPIVGRFTVGRLSQNMGQSKRGTVTREIERRERVIDICREEEKGNDEFQHSRTVHHCGYLSCY